MKIFHCGRCDQLVFFENTLCVRCGHALMFLPDVLEMGILEPDAEGTLRLPGAVIVQGYRPCVNYTNEGICNWAVPVEEESPYCRSCRLTRVIPHLANFGAREAWAALEKAKRRLIYTLLRLRLPLSDRWSDPYGGLAFEFLADDPTPGASPVLTGHAEGLITINVAEADDAEREKRRTTMNEPYRTLLGHFRHEVGHYYWDRLIRWTHRIEAFRSRFGDERQDYGESLNRHHSRGAPAEWQSFLISAYASSHPWEDWAETWAHYLHMVDTLETADAAGLSLRPKRRNEPALAPEPSAVGRPPVSFDSLIERWYPLTYALNSLNRGMGLPDAYPFILSAPVVAKLRFVHEVIDEAKETG